MQMEILSFNIFNVRWLTNIQAARSRGFYYTEHNVQTQMGGQFFNTTSSDNPTVTGFKFAPHTANR